MKPIVKWSGGKRREIEKFEPYFPDMSSIETFIEPFAGGASVFFYLEFQKNNVICDMHADLINFYREIKKGNGPRIYEMMEAHPNDEETYYRVRNSEYETSLEKAFQFYYIRKTCFRGMMRYNKNGKFNIPFGRYKTFSFEEVKDSNYENLLKRTEILLGDFHSVFQKYNDPSNFLFLDPPYDSKFTDYGYCTFTQDDHRRLCEDFKNTKSKCMMIIGRTEFIEGLYSGYIKASFPKKYAFKLLKNRVGNEINTDHLIITNY
jgi:DNA adenine methylase